MIKRFPQKYIFLLVYAFALTGSVRAEQRTWTLTDGATFEAELVTVFSVEAAFKNARGKITKIPLERFSQESRTLIELEQPPKLSFDIIKDLETVLFPAGYSTATQRPPEKRGHYGVRIKQTSAGGYNHELFVELFIIGTERLGEKLILLDRQKASFFLTKENDKEFEFRSEHEATLRKFVVSGSPRGETYYGYLVMVKDMRGEIIAVKHSHNFFENIKNLSERYVGNYMDDTCVRVFPTRPDFD
jgi:hypothetical protein